MSIFSSLRTPITMTVTPIAIRATGIFTINTDFHPKRSTSNPPKAGPAISPVPTTLK